ncbi:aromatic-amino-acid:2-oxoglutarate transaminase [Kluyveromyces lactis]|uniref:KLLA0D11110p n=1 Tax=Kluyveromyces lactis (strain ATCC 8585 / CBS 2359 / DSM 70799 / NBRC 1267 / NRRL Y-1140 / WM37) TaxID=284590 RepID=Q6CR82_KLULA|nr:uncharacterized protein KLLA0_D11110g [Kluyveromyces lactis]CAH00653.1 KLLA0D11110p [Kluyveromyces lactis]|eukprot:XP_453557.1 uncharacterized protein KLLA0_D11110g [Kluyveromyces lactis]
MTVTIDDKTLEEHYSKFLNRHVDRRVILQFWDDYLPKDVKPHPNPYVLAAGMPNEGLFPVESVHVNVVERPFQHLEYPFKSEKIHVGAAGEIGVNEAEYVKSRVDDGSMVDIWRYDPSHGDNIPIAQALQYSDTKGFPQLIDFSKKLVSYLNKPAYDNWDVMLANGSSDSLSKVFTTLTDEDVTVLMEEFTFTPTISNVTANGGIPIPLKVDITDDASQQGINVEYMDQLLENWSTGEYSHLSKPRLLYTIVTGQNPTGMTQCKEKRQKIYDLCEKHDIIIVEDDPYGYLKFLPFDKSDPLKNQYNDGTITFDKYCKEILAPSYLTIDTSGRVIRLETFSKVFAPGMRLSFIVANKFILDKLLKYADISVRSPCGLAQAMTINIIDKWAENFNGDKVRAWLSWVMKVAGEYTHRRNVLFQALEATPAYKEELFELIEPSAGMFISIKINFDKFGEISDKLKAMNFLNYKLLEEGCIVILGYRMAVDKKFSYDRSNFLRITFAMAPDEEHLQTAAERLGKGVERFFKEYHN